MIYIISIIIGISISIIITIIKHALASATCSELNWNGSIATFTGFYVDGEALLLVMAWYLRKEEEIEGKSKRSV
jgi:hypothetical protein